jgi:hypothetical protein
LSKNKFSFETISLFLIVFYNTLYMVIGSTWLFKNIISLQYMSSRFFYPIQLKILRDTLCLDLHFEIDNERSRTKHYDKRDDVIEFISRVTRRVSHVEQELWTLPEHMNSYPAFVSGMCVVHFVKLHVFTFLVPCWDVHFRVKTMFGSSLLSFVL